MSNLNDFVISSGRLEKYTGADKAVVIPDDVMIIGDFAFSNCSNMSSIVIPNGVTTIEDHAFNFCSNLLEVEIPDSVTSMEGWIFDACYNLRKVRLPNRITCIESGTFWNCGRLTDITIPDSVTSIGNVAFYGCRSLTNIVIPETVERISGGAFNHCDKLADNDGFVIIRDTLHYYCGSAGNVEIPEKVKSIGSSAFSYSGTLKTVNLHSGVTSIGDSAFSNCKGLVSINIPNSVSHIGESAFAECISLNNLCIPEGVTQLQEHTFWGCSSLSDISIPESVTLIEKEVFYGCGRLARVTIPHKVTRIEKGTFEGCTGLSQVTFSNALEYISWRAFFGCSSLSEITIPSGVTRIGDEAFAQCVKLSRVDLPESITEFGKAVFDSCNELDTFSIMGSREVITQTTFGQALPNKLILRVAELYPHMTDGAIKKYILDDTVWTQLPVAVQGNIFISRQSKTLESGYLQSITNAQELGCYILQYLLEDHSVKECNAAATFMTMCYKDVEPALLKHLYETIKAAKTSKKAVKTIENCSTLMDKIQTAEDIPISNYVTVQKRAPSITRDTENVEMCNPNIIPHEALCTIVSEITFLQQLLSEAMNAADLFQKSQYIDQFDVSLRKVSQAVENAGFRTVTLDGQLYYPDMAIIPLNIAEFVVGDHLYVEKTVEPIIMIGDQVYKQGTAILGKCNAKDLRN